MDHNPSGFNKMAMKMLCLGLLVLALSENVLGLYDSHQLIPGIHRGYTATQATDYFDRYMEEYLDKNHYTGTTLGVARGNELVYAKGYGTTVRGTAMKPTSLLPVSSISKTITATAVLRLVQDGHLSLTDRVFGDGGVLSSWTPYASGEVKPDLRLQRITVEHLLHHTAGWSQQKPPLYDPLMNEVYLARGHGVLNISREMGLTGDLTQKDIIRFMLGRGLDHTPGTTYEYSNLGYSILGQVIAEVSWMSYGEYVQEHVLEPLGMWHTRLKPEEDTDTTRNAAGLVFDDGEIPLFGHPQAQRPSLHLIDSSLGWYSTVYDIMRFVTGLVDGKLLEWQTLRYLLTPPSSPMFEHQETWPGMGIRVSNTGAWWQVADSHDNEIILYHQATPMALTKPNVIDSDSLSWVLVMSSNNRKNLRSFNEVISSINWSNQNLFLEDCGLPSQDSLSDGNEVLLKPSIPELQFPAYISALSRNNVSPTWISTYTLNSETYMSVVSMHQPTNVKTATFSGLRGPELKLKSTKYSSQGMQLTFVNSYSSKHKHGHIMQIATFASTERTLTSGIHKTHDHYLGVLDKHKILGFTPIVQSIESRNNKQVVSFIFEKMGNTNWKSYSNLTLTQLDGAVRSNAVHDRTLHYLDSYVFEGRLLFSAVFIDEGLRTWHFQATVGESDFADTSKTYLRIGYKPAIITGYELDHKLHFAVLWVKK